MYNIFKHKKHENFSDTKTTPVIHYLFISVFAHLIVTGGSALPFLFNSKDRHSAIL